MEIALIVMAKFALPLLIVPFPARATESFESAYAVAASLGAPITQQRAAARLVRLAPEADQVRRVEALRAVHATFTEGFGTPDLVEAAELLGELTHPEVGQWLMAGPATQTRT